MFRALPATLLVLAYAAASQAADEFNVETIATGFRSPVSVAVRPSSVPETYEVYVADAGAGRVARVDRRKRGAAEDAIIGFVLHADADDTTGPQSLLFIDANRLAVAGSEGEGQPFVRLYELVDPKKPLPADRYEQQIEPPAKALETSGRVDSFRNLSRTHANDFVLDSLALSSYGPEGAATWKLLLRAGMLADMKPLSPPRRISERALSLDVEPRGHVVVVRSENSRDSSGSVAEYINPINGSVSLQLSIPLRGITGIAFSPRTGSLYVIVDDKDGKDGEGLYRVDAASKPDREVSVVKIADVSRPTALAFAPDGSVYVASQGNGSGKGGSLVRVSGKL